MKWVTREKARLDRIACPWLISRTFLFLPASQVKTVAESPTTCLVLGAGTMATVYRLGLIPGLGAGVAPESWQATRAVDSATRTR